MNSKNLSEKKELFKKLPKLYEISNNLPTINEFSDIKDNKAKNLRNSIKKSSSYINQSNNLNNIIPNFKRKLNSNEKSKNNINCITKFPSLSLNKKIRINNYEKKKKYIVKLKKTNKIDYDEDKLFKLLHEYGLHYSFSSLKYIIGDNYHFYSKYRQRRKPKGNSSTNNIDINSQSNINSVNNNISSENIKNKSIQGNKLKSSPDLFYSTLEEDDEDKMSYRNYMKLQSIADIRFRPRFGDTSYDLVNYIKKIDLIRKGVVNNLISQINNVENRYNIEKPKEDSKFNTKMQGLYNHKWKNIFSLKDYQGLFISNLRGKISDKNYDIMDKNFRNISHMCFSKTNTNFSKINFFQN